VSIKQSPVLIVYQKCASKALKCASKMDLIPFLLVLVETWNAFFSFSQSTILQNAKAWKE